MRVQGSDVKSVTELGGDATKLTHDDQVYITANSLNKTLKDAIVDWTTAPSALSTIVTASGTTYSMTSTASESVINHVQTATCTYQLPAAIAGKRFVFKHSGYRADATTFTNEIRIQPNTGNQIRWRNNMTINPGYISISKPGVTLTLIALDSITWVVSRLAYENHEKNSGAMGQYQDDVSLVGRNSWIVRLANPESKYGAGCFALNGYGYACGGQTGSIVATVHKYTDSLDTWQIRTSMTTARYSPGSFSLNGFGYCVGGYNGGYRTENERYNDSTNLWASRGAIGGMGDMLGANLNGYGYLFGGDYPASAIVQRYNDSTDSWATVSSISLARWSASSISLNGFAYACGGYANTYNTSVVDQYNDSNNTCIVKSPMPYTDSGSCGLSLNGYGCFAGGMTDNSGATNTSATSQYNDSVNTWTAKGPTTQLRGQYQGFSINGFGYGVCGVNPGYVSYVDQYN